MSIKDDVDGRTLAEVSDMIEAPRLASWAKAEERADEIRAALDTPAPAPAEAPPNHVRHVLTDSQGRTVSAWFVRIK